MISSEKVTKIFFEGLENRWCNARIVSLQTMNTYVALLRGINVGGHKKIKMVDLREVLGTAGLTDVKTYIQSGNVVFSSSESASECEHRISETIKKEYGWDVPVLVRTTTQIEKILKGCPFPQEKKEKSYFTILKSKPSEEKIAEANTVNYPGEEYFVTPECIYYFCGIDYTKAKLSGNWFEKKLETPITTRNYRTMMKLIEMSS